MKDEGGRMKVYSGRFILPPSSFILQMRSLHQISSFKQWATNATDTNRWGNSHVYVRVQLRSV